MHIFFILLLLATLGGVGYLSYQYYAQRTTRHQVPNNTKKHFGISLLVLLISIIGLNLTNNPSPSKASHDTKQTSESIAPKPVKSQYQKLKKAVNNLFLDTDHTELAADVDQSQINSVKQAVKKLDNQKQQASLLKSITTADHLYQLILQKSTSESQAQSASESVTQATSESVAKAESESQVQASIKAESESVVSRQAAEQAQAAKVASESAVKAQAAAAASQQQASTQAAQSTAGVYTGTSGSIIGNTNSHIYHVPGQAGYHMNSANATYFNTEQEAINAGYRKSLR